MKLNKLPFISLKWFGTETEDTAQVFSGKLLCQSFGTNSIVAWVSSKNSEKKAPWSWKINALYSEAIKSDLKAVCVSKLVNTETNNNSTCQKLFRNFLLSPKKLENIRGVWDALNDVVLIGPGTMRFLWGLFFNFQAKPVAFIADIKKKFLHLEEEENEKNTLNLLYKTRWT